MFYKFKKKLEKGNKILAMLPNTAFFFSAKPWHIYGGYKIHHDRFHKDKERYEDGTV